MRKTSAPVAVNNQSEAVILSCDFFNND
jgi:WD40 repeat protein